jgi:hypothetical protein
VEEYGVQGGVDGEEEVRDVEQRREDEATRSDQDQRVVTIEESADSQECNISAPEAEEGEERPKMEIVAERQQDQDESPEGDPPTFKEREVESKPIEDVTDAGDAAEETVIERERKEPLNLESGEVRENSESAKREDLGEPSAVSAEDFEMVDRDRTLIDMVFGRGKGK